MEIHGAGMTLMQNLLVRKLQRDQPLESQTKREDEISMDFKETVLLA
jgi:hypothetical protein